MIHLTITLTIYVNYTCLREKKSRFTEASDSVKVTLLGRAMGTPMLLKQWHQFSPVSHGAFWVPGNSVASPRTLVPTPGNTQMPCPWKSILIGGSSREKTLCRLRLRVWSVSSLIPTGSFPTVHHPQLLCHLNPAPCRHCIFI